MAAALQLAKEILPRGPVAVRAAKTAMNEGMQCDSNTGMRVEELCYAQVLGTADRYWFLVVVSHMTKIATADGKD